MIISNSFKDFTNWANWQESVDGTESVRPEFFQHAFSAFIPGIDRY
jgi:hypothetical protein